MVSDITDTDLLFETLTDHVRNTLNEISYGLIALTQSYKQLYYTTLDIHAYLDAAETCYTKQSQTQRIDNFFSSFLTKLTPAQVTETQASLQIMELNPIKTLATSQTINLLTSFPLTNSTSTSPEQVLVHLNPHTSATQGTTTFYGPDYMVVENTPLREFQTITELFNETHPRHDVPSPTALTKVGYGYRMTVDYAVKRYGGKMGIRILSASLQDDYLNSEHLLLCAVLKIGFARVHQNTKGEPTLIWADSPY